MLSSLVIDSSTLLAFEKAGMVDFLHKVGLRIFVPNSVKAEIEAGGKSSVLDVIQVVPLRGRSIKKSGSLENLGIGKGEADCCVLAARLNLGFIVCDDRKFVRQRFLSSEKSLKSVTVFGFSLLLHLLLEKHVIPDVWPFFERIIAANNWRRSDVEAANVAFLIGMGYRSPSSFSQ